MDSQLKDSQLAESSTPIQIAPQCFDTRHGPYGQAMASILVTTGEQLIADIYRADKAELQTESFDTLPPILEGRNLYKLLGLGKEQSKAWESWDYLLGALLSPMTLTKIINRRLRGNSDHSHVRREILASIIAISWALYNRAIIEQNKVMDRGSFAIHDPEYRLYNYLLNYIKLATRNSSPGFFLGANDFGYDRNPREHRSSHYREDIKQHGGDIRLWGGGPALPLLPNEATTYLFGSIDRNDMPFFWIKFEEFGLGNWLESINHLFCFLRAGHVQPSNVYREKDIPLAMRQAYTAFKQLVIGDSKHHATAIHEMWKEMLAQYKSAPTKLLAGLIQSFQKEAINQQFNPAQLTYRTGNEVIFDYRELFYTVNPPLYKTIEFNQENIIRFLPPAYIELYLHYQQVSSMLMSVMKQRPLASFLEEKYAKGALENSASALKQLDALVHLSEISYFDLIQQWSELEIKEKYEQFKIEYSAHVKKQETGLYSLPAGEQEMVLFLTNISLASHWLGQLNYLILHQNNTHRSDYKKTRDLFFETGQKIYHQLLLYVSLLSNETNLKEPLTKLLHAIEFFQKRNQFLFYQYEPSLIRAAAMGDDKNVSGQLKKHSMLNLEYRSRRNETPLYIASTEGHPKVVQKLYQYGADIDRSGPKQESAFVAAALHGHKDVICSMLDVRDNAMLYSGMKRREQDSLGNTALHYMISSAKWSNISARQVAIDRYLVSVIPPKSWLSSYNYSSIAKYTSIQNKAGDTPLHLLAKMNFPASFLYEIPTRLKRKGLDVSRIFDLNIVNKKNQTPLDIAISNRNVALVEYLYSLGGRSSYKALMELEDCLKLCRDKPDMSIELSNTPEESTPMTTVKKSLA